MKKIAEVWSEFRGYTEDFTRQCRTLAFGGIAVCWLFKSETFTFPSLIYVSLIWFVAYFLADLLQMFIGALMRKYFAEYQEAKAWKEKGTIDVEIHVPRWLDWPAFGFFVAKGGFLLLAFGAIACELAIRLLCLRTP